MRVFTEMTMVRLSPELKDQVAALAAEEQRPLASMLRILVERGMSMTDMRNNAATKARKTRKG